MELTYWEVIANTNWGRYITEIEKRIILKASRLAGNPTIALEVGCEGGRWTKLLYDLGWKTICTDIDQIMLNKCKNNIPEAECICVSPNGSIIPCNTETIKLLLCIEVAPVIKSEWFIHESFRVLQNDGLLVGVFGNLLSWRGLFFIAKRCWYSLINNRSILDKLERINFYNLTYPVWKKKFCKGGFNIIHEEGLCWFPFRRDSNFPFIRLFAKMERLLHLHNLITLSPWIVFIAKKNDFS
jgi:SAM-dependent methyltransferase